MPKYDANLREEEIKNRLRQDFFAKYDASPIIGNIDFAVAAPKEGGSLFETEYFLWAESKKGTKASLKESFVQLILTIGKKRTYENLLPPKYLGACDAEKIAFIDYSAIMDVFSMNDFNWNVTPSDHSTREFGIMLEKVENALVSNEMIFYYDIDESELKSFISKNFTVGEGTQKIQISKTNFTAIYQKWREEVKPTIAVNWDVAQQKGIIDSDFYLADMLAEQNNTLLEKLYVVLRTDHYELDRNLDSMGMFNSKEATFTDKQRAHKLFWNRYNRPPKREYWDYIIERRDLLVPQDVRERKGSFYTPREWVELSQQYLAEALGDDWQDEYVIWDCAAGTGNLLANLTNKYKIYASTLDRADVDVMRDRIHNGANLVEKQVFQFDFLNDSLDSDKVPRTLRDILKDEEKRKKLIIYINPPYAEASNARQAVGTGSNRANLAKETKTYQKYFPIIREGARELFAQFIIRICKEIDGAVIAEFSTLKAIQASNFKLFRKSFRAKLQSFFLVPADTFDNVKGKFPIGFFIWDTTKNEHFHEAEGDVYLYGKREVVCRKKIYSYDGMQLVIDWLRQFYDKEGERIAYLGMRGTDFQNNKYIHFTLTPSDNDVRKSLTANITRKNVMPACIYLAVRQVIEETWLNDRDQFLFPLDTLKNDKEFQNDCLAYALFHGQNRISSECGVNHWIPFTEAEVDAKEKFSSNFMSDYIAGKYKPEKGSEPTQNSLFTDEDTICNPPTEPIVFSAEAQAVMDAGRLLWKYYHAQVGANPNASFYDIRKHFQGTKVTKSGKEQMDTKSDDEEYNELIANLRDAMKLLGKKIEPGIYLHGFLK